MCVAFSLLCDPRGLPEVRRIQHSLYAKSDITIFRVGCTAPRRGCAHSCTRSASVLMMVPQKGIIIGLLQKRDLSSVYFVVVSSMRSTVLWGLNGGEKRTHVKD